LKEVTNFEDLITSVIDGGVGDLNLTAANLTLPPLTTCPNSQLTELLPTHMDSMTHDKPETYINKTIKNEDGTDVLDSDGNPKLLIVNKAPVLEDTTRLKAGQEVNMWCKDLKTQPSEDIYDLDPFDGKISAVCQPDGMYSVRVTQLAQCITVCDQSKIPLPDLKSGLVIKGIKARGDTKVKLVMDFAPEEFIWAGDRLVYGCRQKNYGVEGGADITLDRYMCTNYTNFDTPQEAGRWPVCRPQAHMIIDAVERMLEKYDVKVENRYKLIRYQEEDGKDSIVINDHMMNVTVPTVASMIILIIIALLCSRNDSPICSICASKNDA